ncbi:zinc finger MYM-type protein 1-like [Leptinotarsa decemlineata]|uniref:zinc finger MYM-type protein 1-like n=1 Tax=Leptinotarsa decemlineata TaxID=7539 RepID=UPI003D308612
MKNWLSKEQDKTQTKKDDGLFLDTSTPSSTSTSVHLQSFTSGTETEPPEPDTRSLAFESEPQRDPDPESPSNSIDKPTPLEHEPELEPFCFDPDPANWVVNNELRDYVSQHGIIQNKEGNFSKAKKEYGNRFWSFSSAHFYRHLENGEKQNRAWLVYSESKCSVFCGPCRLFHSESQLESSFVKNGFSDWKNVTARLKEHENSVSHKNNTITSKDRGEKLGKVDSQLTEMIDQEMNSWQMLLQRVVVVIKALASRGLPFRGSTELFGSNSNGNYMMLLEVLAEFDPFLREHIRKYGNPGIGHISYLSSTICDEYIELLAKKVTDYILEEASYISCAGHSLNLVGTHAVDSCIEAVSLFTLLQELYNFFSSSTHRWAVLNNCKNTTLTTKSLSTTRWSARHDALRALQEEWPAIIRALEILESDTDQKANTRAEAKGLLSRLNRLETAIIVKLWGTTFFRLNKVNKYVQNEDTDALAVTEVFNSLISFFEELRNQFDIYENKALDVSETKIYEYDNRRNKTRKLQDDETRDGEVSFTTGRDSFRVNTFIPIIDKVKQELTARMHAYEEFVTRFVAIIKLSDLTTEEIEVVVNKLLSVFENDLEPVIFDELVYLRSHMSTNKIENKNKKPLSLYKWIIGNKLEDIYPNVEILLRMFICTPVTNASAERSFSCLKRIKEYHRSNMTQTKLNSLALLNIENDVTKTLDFTNTIQSFAWSKARKRKF